MKKRKNEELTTEDAPDSIAPWEMLEDDEIASLTTRVRERLPDRVLKAFARRTDNDQCACFDQGADGKGKSVVLIDLRTGAEVRQFSSFSAWFDAVTA